MASRQEEKERRKQERLEREKAEAAAAQRKRLLQIGAGVAIAAAIVVGIIVMTSGGKDDKPNPNPTAAVPIPDRKITDLEDAAKAANCQLTNPPIEGSNHVTTKVKYKTNPPTSGDHVPPQEVASDGNYTEGVAPEPERYVHSLEHGRIVIHYKPTLPKRQVGQLLTLFGENSDTDFGLASVGGGFTLLLKNNTQMPDDVAATAWGHLLACKTMNDKTFDAIRAFRQRYVLQGPEKVTEPQ